MYAQQKWFYLNRIVGRDHFYYRHHGHHRPSQYERNGLPPAAQPVRLSRWQTSCVSARAEAVRPISPVCLSCTNQKNGIPDTNVIPNTIKSGILAYADKSGDVNYNDDRADIFRALLS